MATRGRKPGFKMPEEHRTKIANSKILNRLINHAEGKEDMKPTEIQAALGLLDRVMPKLQATTLSGDEDRPVVIESVTRRIVRAGD